MIIVPDDPGPAGPDDVFKAAVRKVFDGDGFLASVWHPYRQAWVERVPFRFAFIDAPEMEQPFGQEAKDFLAGLIADKELRLDPVGKEFDWLHARRPVQTDLVHGIPDRADGCRGG
ncbi:MAG: thermonuclease family protein [Erythrobacter sp.]